MEQPSTSTSLNSTKDVSRADKALINAFLTTEGASSLNIVSSAPAEEKAKKTQAAELVETTTTGPDTDFKPIKETPPALATKYEIAAPLLRFPLTLKKLRKVSTFIPISINYFQVIHMMDTLMATNVYFQRLGLPWHPLVSRLYFSIIFFIQTLRAMRHARIGSSTTRLFTEQLLRDYPAEKIPIPGPLVPILQSICACESDDPLYGMICPQIRNDVGVEEAHLLWDEDSQDFILPNIPLIASFLNTIIHADGPIPDYSNPDTFSDLEDHVIMGHEFEADNWDLIERAALLSPGLNCMMESNPDIDDNMHVRGQELDIPTIGREDSILGIERYMLMETNSTWFHNLIDVMSTYCSFFKESTTLSSCSPYGPTSPLIRSRLHTLTGRNANDNIINTLQHAFPGRYPYKLKYEHRSFELAIPQAYQLMGEFSAINTSSDYRGLNLWGNFNQPNTGRTGPYWNQNPSNLQSLQEESLTEIENIISNDYFIEDPTQKAN